jgi:hypothetical protein
VDNSGSRGGFGLANETEKRKHRRLPVRWPVAVQTARGTVEGETRNISASGVYIWCNKPVRVSAISRIFIIPPEYQPIEVTVEAVWSKVYGADPDDEELSSEIGALFVKISDEDREFLSHLASESS